MSNLLTWLGPRRAGAIALTAALCTVASLTACGSNNDSGTQGGQSGGAETITMWTLEDVQVRIDATKKIAADYSAKTRQQGGRGCRRRRPVPAADDLRRSGRTSCQT